MLTITTFLAILLTNSFVLLVSQHTQHHCMSQASKTIPVIYQKRDLLYLLLHIYKYVFI